MKLQLLSDTHFEFDPDHGIAFIDSLDPTSSDVLILAGDIGSGEIAISAVGRVCEVYKDKPIIYVMGNHELYGTPRQAMLDHIEGLRKKHDNLVFLDKTISHIESRRFLGATLWYPMPRSFSWSDFRHVAGLGAWLPQEANNTRDFFRDNLQSGDVVVTHMLPSHYCVHEKWQGNPDNIFFVHDLTHLIMEREPKIWLYGHTHESNDHQVGQTRLVCSPRGYPFEGRRNGYMGTIVEV